MGLFLTDADCIRQRKYVNIPAWHDKGYTGEGLGVFCDDVGGSHAERVAAIIQTILPKATVLTGSIGHSQKGGIVSDVNIACKETGELLSFDEFIKKHNINLINNSKGGNKRGVVTPIALWMQGKIKEHNLIFCGSSGNTKGASSNQKYKGACIMVGSAVLEDNGTVRWAGNTASDEAVDFVMFSGFTAGSSFSSPFLLGMAGLLRSKYPSITQEEVYDYFKSHCEDILEPGKDEKTGWGLPIMGKVETEIVMQIGNHKITVDGKPIILDQCPVYNERGDRTLVPLRAIAEAFGATVEWDGVTRTIKIVR